jgi:hypothetical protein
VKAILGRLKRLETVQAIERLRPVELQIGYLKKLPADYAGERREVTAGRLADGHYLWEARPGPPPVTDESNRRIFKVVLVRAKDGKPDYSWPDEALP